MKQFQLISDAGDDEPATAECIAADCALDEEDVVELNRLEVGEWKEFSSFNVLRLA